MTQLAAICSIPAEGLRHQARDTVWTLIPVGCGGYSLNIRTNDTKTGGDWYQFSTNALNAWNAIVDANPAAVPASVRTLPAPAKGTATHMSPAEVQVITEAVESTGTIRRGRGYAAADLRSLQAMAKRGFVTLDHPIRPHGAAVTAYGRRTAEQLHPIAA